MDKGVDRSDLVLQQEMKMGQRISRRGFVGGGVAAVGAMVLGNTVLGAEKAKRTVVIWAEGTAPKKVYPKEINGAIAEGLKRDLEGWEVVTVLMTDAEQGLPDELLNRADVLIWWGHLKHDQVKDELVAKIVRRVKEEGMGFIGLHSAHFAKPNRALLGTECSWGAYLFDGATLTVTVKEPGHPIAKGVKEFTVAHDEHYSDPYAVPTPRAVVFEGVAKTRDGGKDPSQVGFTWEIGKGKAFYFQAGHESNPIFYDENVRKIMANAVEWAAK